VTNDELVERIVKRFPYPAQIREWDTARDGSVRFTWRGSRFRVSDNLFVETVEGAFLSGGDISILAQALLRTETRGEK
jgi:hypothetical protein